MKKKAILVLSTLFLVHAIVAVPAWWNNLTNRLRQIPGGIARTWYCATNPAQYKCTAAEHKRGIAWVAAAGTALGAVLLGAGIKVTQSELQRQKEMAQVEYAGQLKEVVAQGQREMRAEEIAKQKMIERSRELEEQEIEQRVIATGEYAAANPVLNKLIVAASLNRIPIAEEAISQGANVNERTASGLTILELAALNKNTEMVIFLLSKGATPVIRTDLDTTQRIRDLVGEAQLGQARRFKVGKEKA